MKLTNKLWMAVLVAFALLAAPTRAADQFGVDPTFSPSTVTHAPLTTNTAPIAIIGFIQTNFVTVSASKIMPIPSDGRFGLFIQAGATNALTVTNCTCVVEGLVFTRTSAGALRTNVVDNNGTINISFPVNGTTPSDFVTNFTGFPTSLGTLTDTRWASWDALRIRTCTNVNSETIWLTNFMQFRPRALETRSVP